ncbi:MAG: cell division topological specificity factor MinE [Deltaproteobacteria bacterium]|nr:cell division topological specificity factor MinE [Deltaproteobacteria bacterium]
MREILNRFFGSRGASKDDAKQRLKFLLIHDQVDLTPAQLEAMKAEILEVVCRYLDVDPQETVFRLERLQDKVALVSSVPVRRVTERTVHQSARA